MASWLRYLRDQVSNQRFLQSLSRFEDLVSKVLSVTMVVVILVSLVDLIIVLMNALISSTPGNFFRTTLTEVFGLFLSVLIALEILENITAYLRKHVVQVQLVIATALTAVGRKIIILDLEKISGTSLIGLAIAILALAISYWIVRATHRQR